MQLTLKQRIVFPDLYPQKASMNTQATVRDIKEKVKLSDEDRKKIDLKAMGDGRVSYDSKKEFSPISVEFTEAELSFLKGRVSEMNEQKEITIDQLDLCELIRDCDAEKSE